MRNGRGLAGGSGGGRAKRENADLGRHPAAAFMYFGRPLEKVPWGRLVPTKQHVDG